MATRIILILALFLAIALGGLIVLWPKHHATASTPPAAPDPEVAKLIETLEKVTEEPQTEDEKRAAHLQTNFNRFPLLRPMTDTNGEPVFQKINLQHVVWFNHKPVCGFRFKVPPRTNNEDFVWAFVEPKARFEWDILPQSGDMDGFSTFHYLPMNYYLGLGTVDPQKAKTIYLQSLPGNRLEDGKTYLVWVGLDWVRQSFMLLRFTFAKLNVPDGDDETPAIAKALGLHHHQSTDADFTKQLQAECRHFPLLSMATNAQGEAAFQTIDITNGVMIEDRPYCGFRFQVPPRAHHEDFAFAFIEPADYVEWDIAPQSGEMAGFSDKPHEPPRTHYAGTEKLFPLAGKKICLQSFSGTNLQDGDTYFVWINYQPGSAWHFSVKFAFGDLKAVKGKEGPALEKVLGLHRH